MRHKRCQELFGIENFNKFKEFKILIIGVGGVGSYALDCLYRSGIENITIIDYDRYEESNLNRQIGANGAIGRLKTERLKELYPKIETINKKVDKEWVRDFDFNPFDIIIDACDMVDVKVEIAIKEPKKLLMSLGSAKRYDASKIEVTNIWNTYNDPLAKKIRERLKKRNFKKKIKVVFSKEEPKTTTMGSFVGVTGSFGLFLCSEAIKMILDKITKKRIEDESITN